MCGIAGWIGKINYNNTSNKFDLSQYERDIQENLIDKIVDNIIFTFDTLNSFSE